MKKTNIYAGYRYPSPSQIISHAVWFYHRLTLSFCDIKKLLAARALPSVTKPSITGAINSAKGIVAKLGRTEGN
jgi:transposase-like protein